jgi:hypothetical protein
MPQATSWMTSSDIIASVQRRISFPISQNTFSNDDILAFANEELLTSQMPSILQYHEEFYVYKIVVPLQINVSRYAIPDRAVGMRLRDLKWTDESGNFFDMARISDNDKGYFQRSVGANQQIHKYYIEGNDIILTPEIIDGPTGALNFFIFMRPNQLVANARAAIIQNFNQTVTLAGVSGGDSLYVNAQAYSAVASPSGPFQFQLGASDAITAMNMATFFNLPNTLKLVGNLISATAVGTSVTFRFTNQNYSFSFNNKAFDAFADVNIISNTFQIQSNGLANNTQIVFSAPISSTLPSGIVSSTTYYVINATTNTFQVSLTLAGSPVLIEGTGSGTCFITTNLSSPSFQIPLSTSGVEFTTLPSTYTDPTTNITEPLFIDNVMVDFLQTKPGHKIENFDVTIPVNGISGTNIQFESTDIPSSAIVGDYICLSNESIIPYIPPDLHNVLAERTAARILAAMGDQQGLQNSMAKLQEMEKNTGSLVDNRVENSPKKINARHSLLHYGKTSARRRY